MKGATALPPPKMTIDPSKIRIAITGTSQYFFLSRMNIHKSFKNSIELSICIKSTSPFFFLFKICLIGFSVEEVFNDHIVHIRMHKTFIGVFR